MKDYKLLDRSFFMRETTMVAQELLGKLLVRTLENGQKLSGIIVETEAYCGLSDSASHAYKGKTERCASMFGPVGHAYVYFTYGMHYCLNLVARENHIAAGGVLIRALEPIDGIEIMQLHRSINDKINISNGPGKLTKALAITREPFNGINVLSPQAALKVADMPPIVATNIKVTPRIGISTNKDKLWRFYIANNPWVSKK